MASTFTDSLRLEQMAKGDQNGTWGGTLNTQLDMIEEAIAGYAAITHDDTANLTLTTANGTADQARNAVLRINGTLTAARNMVIPSASKVYIIHNATTGGFGVTVKTAAGAGVLIPNGRRMAIYCDGTDCFEVSTDFTNLTAKTTPVDADSLAIVDSAATNILKKLTFANLKAFIRSYLLATANSWDLVQTFAATPRVSHATLPSLEFFTSVVRGILSYNESTSDFTIDSDGNVVIKTNNTDMARFSASGVLSLLSGGIKFPATQVPSADANTLDDYEEGSWTPLLTFAGGSTGQSMSVRSGSYIKIGKVVHLFFSLTMALKGSSTGDLWLEGFPFAVASNDVGSGAFKSADDFSGLTGALSIDVRASTTRAYIGQWEATGTSAVTDANCTNTTAIFGMLTYHAAS